MMYDIWRRTFLVYVLYLYHIDNDVRYMTSNIFTYVLQQVFRLVNCISLLQLHNKKKMVDCCSSLHIVLV